MRRDPPRRERIPPRRDVITTEAAPIGALAVALHDAHRKIMDAEAQLERLLDSLYGDNGWSNFEAGETFELDVYDCTPSEAAAEALMRAGFRVVGQHEHALAKFVNCACVRARKEPV